MYHTRKNETYHRAREILSADRADSRIVVEADLALLRIVNVSLGWKGLKEEEDNDLLRPVRPKPRRE